MVLLLVKEEQKPGPKTAGRKQGTHYAARQPKAHPEKLGICPGSQRGKGRRDQNPGLLSQAEASETKATNNKIY